MDIFTGSIMSFAFPFAPTDWGLCNGNTLSISQYEVLYVLLGTTYGGDGTTNFMIPNLMGRMPMGQGQGGGLSLRTIGQVTGNESTTLQAANIPAHNHAAASTINVNTSITLANPGTGQLTAPSDINAWIGAADAASGAGNANIFASEAGASSAQQKGITNTLSADISLSAVGNPAPQSLPLVNPSLVLNFCIALQGIFPSRN